MLLSVIGGSLRVSRHVAATGVPNLPQDGTEFAKVLRRWRLAASSINI
jgi:hypothetical protein